MDVVDLREFYASPLGQASRRLIARRIRSRWDDVGGATVIGLGYATPYLEQFRQLEREARAAVRGLWATGQVAPTPLASPVTTPATDAVAASYEAVIR